MEIPTIMIISGLTLLSLTLYFSARNYRELYRLSQLQTSPLVKIRIVYVTQEISEYILMESQITRMFIATFKLHVDPGLNMRSGKRATPAQTILLYRQTQAGLQFTSYDLGGKALWYSTPNLRKDNDPKGAILFDGVQLPSTVEWGKEKILWQKLPAHM